VFDEYEHQRHLDKNADDSGERGPRTETEQRDCSGDGQFEEVAGADEGPRGSHLMSNPTPPHQPESGGVHDDGLNDERYGDERDVERLVKQKVALE